MITENLALTGSGNINATGNSSDNFLTGNSGNNELTGSSGNDNLRGLEALIPAGGDEMTIY